MRRFLKGLSIFFLVLIAFVSIYYLYKRSVVNDLKQKELKANREWLKLGKKIQERNLSFYYAVQKARQSNLKILTEVSFAEIENDFSKSQNGYSNSCSEEFMRTQYNLNKEYLQLLNFYKKDSIAQKDSSFLLLRNISLMNSEINALKLNYNDLAMSYNEYYSTFPNFFIAKNNGFTRKHLFEITFGIENKDPSKKNSELPEWAKGVDTL